MSKLFDIWGDKTDNITGMRALCAEIAALQDKVRWVPVGERLPEEERNYEIGRKGVFLGIGYWDRDKKRFEKETRTGYVEVSVDCWRELPVPPIPAEGE